MLKTNEYLHPVCRYFFFDVIYAAIFLFLFFSYEFYAWVIECMCGNVRKLIYSYSILFEFISTKRITNIINSTLEYYSQVFGLTKHF